MHRTPLTFGSLLTIVGALLLPGCQLVVDFDRDMILPDAGSDAGPADSATTEAGTADAD